ncbi:MAG: c-type cytochrome [Chlorobi bacterium]|nr:c-type cytochrome [Chlorobiota bacterium]
MRTLALLFLAALMMGLSSCGGNEQKENKATEATQAVENAAEKTKEAATKAAEEVKEAANEVKEAASEAANEVKEAAQAATGKDGKTLFESNGCVACHKVDQKSIGPSLKEIAAAYQGKEQELIDFLKGKHEAIVDPAQFAVMQPNLEITKKMADEDVKAIADYILSVK